MKKLGKLLLIIIIVALAIAVGVKHYKDNTINSDETNELKNFQTIETNKTEETEKTNKSEKLDRLNNSEESDKLDELEETKEKQISVEEATKILEDKYGTIDTNTGNKMSYNYMTIVKDKNNNKYYAFRHNWIVDNSHASFLQNVFVSFDGKSVKTTSKPQEFAKEEVVEFED